MTTGQDRRRQRYLTVAEVAETMRVSKMTVYRLTRSGELSAVRVGRSYRVPQDALDTYLASAVLRREDRGHDGGHGQRASG
jgi:excisionase family DNA binding protein